MVRPPYQSFVSGNSDKYNGLRSSLVEWCGSPQGRYVLEWESAQFGRAVEDVFGFRAAQLGLPHLDMLRSNRIPFRFALALEPGAAVAADPFQLPLASESLDLLAVPHTLEFHADPHQVLREAARVLRPEGQIVISGFNSLSLWRVRQMFAGRDAGAPWNARFISLLKLRDWLRLLGFELNGGRFGCYAPPFRSAEWLSRVSFIEHAGARWWPIAGGVYVVRAVKRVQGVMMITPAWRRERARRRGLAALPQRRGQSGLVNRRGKKR